MKISLVETTGSLINEIPVFVAKRTIGALLAMGGAHCYDVAPLQGLDG